MCTALRNKKIVIFGTHHRGTPRTSIKISIQIRQERGEPEKRHIRNALYWWWG